MKSLFTIFISNIQTFLSPIQNLLVHSQNRTQIGESEKLRKQVSGRKYAAVLFAGMALQLLSASATSGEVVFEQPPSADLGSLISDVVRQRAGFDSFVLAEDTVITDVHWYDSGFGPSTRTFTVSFWEDSGNFFIPPTVKIFETTAVVQSTIVAGTNISVFSLDPFGPLALLGSTKYWLSVQVTDASTWSWTASSISGLSLTKNTATGEFVGGFQGINLAFALTAGPESVAIDIKPGSDPNCFNINGHGVIPVAMLGSETFDVMAIDQGSLSFGGLDVRVRGNKGPLCSVDYSDGDAFLDLVCQFEDDATNWDPGDDDATLTGALLDGTEFEGTDSICVVP